jgi:peroxidase
VEEAVQQEKRMGASILRLHFHDCFVNGCDGSILLDSTPQFVSEKMAVPNNNSARGFEVIDRIKAEVDLACGAPVVSCADILAVAARDSVVALGGPSWEVPLGRRDSTYANINTANSDIPAPSLDLPGLVASFKKQGLDIHDLVALSGGHTLGFAQCRLFRPHIYNDTNIDSGFRRQLQAVCPLQGGDANLHSLDPTPAFFDSKYFSNIMAQKGLLHSDQELLSSHETGYLVNTYSYSLDSFAKDFARSMVKMGKIKPLVGHEGQIRCNCRKVN